LVEQLTLNQRVEGSSPSTPTNAFNHLAPIAGVRFYKVVGEFYISRFIRFTCCSRLQPILLFAGAPMRRALKPVPSTVAGTAETPLTLDERRTDELVFAMVGPVGSGVTFTANILADILRKDYGYEGAVLTLSSFITKYAEIVGGAAVDASDPERVLKLQDIGNRLREKLGTGCLAELGVRDINMARGSPKGLPAARRHFTVLDSIKNPEEAEILREVYQDALSIVGVFAPESVRKKRLAGQSLSEKYIADIFERDQADGLAFGQNVKGTMELADFYVRNDGENDIRVRQALTRYLEIMFGIGVHTPTREEMSMQAASALATGSACLSRRVGAVIVSKSGETIGHGLNDVPRFGGGLYTSESGEGDHRCWKWKGRECHNDGQKKKLLEKVQGQLAAARVLKASATGIQEAVARAGIRNLIEFSRSVHAEMEAIISVARTGKGGILGSTLYTTTFPCHNCARHIVASGIERVIYIEPYTKSLALELHDDAISVDARDDGKKVLFLQFEGVAPRNMMRLFTQQTERKEDGRARSVPRTKASPVCKAPLDGFETRERLIVAKLGTLSK
jgi:deoxycytidylate deaminase